MAFKPKVIDLDGLRVVLVKEERQSVLVQAIVDAGSREETDEQAGAAHFLEHFVFRGTEKFPGVFDIGEKVDAIGGAMNAWTSQVDTGFWVKAAKNNLDLAIEMVGQMITKPKLPEKYFEKERGTIIQEYHMYEDQPGSKASKTMWQLLMGKTNMGRDIIGTLESLKGMKVEYLSSFMDSWYTAKNVLVGVVGSWDDEEKLLKKIRQEFAGLYERNHELPERNRFSWVEQTAPRVELVKRKVDQAKVSIGLPGTPLVHPLSYVRPLVNIILGGSNGSRLFKEVREKRGWAYSVGSGADNFKDLGMVGIGGGFPKDKLKEALELTIEIAMGLTGKSKWSIKKKELLMAKECYRGRLSLNYDVPEKVLGYAMHDLINRDRIYSAEDVLAEANKVTMEQVEEYCNLVFRHEKLNVGVVGDYEELPFKL